jgi:hypothetical protein
LVLALAGLLSAARRAGITAEPWPESASAVTAHLSTLLAGGFQR